MGVLSINTYAQDELDSSSDYSSSESFQADMPEYEDVPSIETESSEDYSDTYESEYIEEPQTSADTYEQEDFTSTEEVIEEPSVQEEETEIVQAEETEEVEEKIQEETADTEAEVAEIIESEEEKEKVNPYAFLENEDKKAEKEKTDLASENKKEEEVKRTIASKEDKKNNEKEKKELEDYAMAALGEQDESLQGQSDLGRFSGKSDKPEVSAYDAVKSANLAAHEIMRGLAAPGINNGFQLGKLNLGQSGGSGSSSFTTGSQFYNTGRFDNTISEAPGFNYSQPGFGSNRRSTQGF